MIIPQSAIRVTGTLSTRNLLSLFRSFGLAAWLGWQIESNWTDPFLFAIYSIVKPLSSAAILVVMYSLITRGNFDSPVFPYIYLGNAFYLFVGAVMTGISYSVIDDRERYRMLKYFYVAPIQIPIFLLGRGVARMLTATSSVFITLMVGILILHIKIDLSAVDWLLFLLSLAIGAVMLAMMGLILAGITLTLAHHVGFIGDAVAGALFLFSGAIFPLDVLPQFLRPIGFINPITYWLELLRRALISPIAGAFPTLTAFSNLQLILILIGLTIAFGILARFIFRACDQYARDRGKIDQTTNY